MFCLNIENFIPKKVPLIQSKRISYRGEKLVRKSSLSLSLNKSNTEFEFRLRNSDATIHSSTFATTDVVVFVAFKRGTIDDDTSINSPTVAVVADDERISIPIGDILRRDRSLFVHTVIGDRGHGRMFSIYVKEKIQFQKVVVVVKEEEEEEKWINLKKENNIIKNEKKKGQAFVGWFERGRKALLW